jgi:signal transduction histidine kinase
MFHERHAVVEVILPDQAPALMVDPDRVMQVMLNLLSNAAKFVPSSGGHVDVRLEVDDTGVTVSVQDNGPGVDVAQQALIFDRFRQGGDSANRPQGTGLGLPISRQIVEHFGGRLWLESHLGQGGCFRFFLPVQAAGETTPATIKGDKT